MSGKLTHFHSLLPYCTEPGDREGGGGTGSLQSHNRNVIHSPYFQHAHFIPLVGVGKRGAY